MAYIMTSKNLGTDKKMILTPGLPRMLAGARWLAMTTRRPAMMVHKVWGSIH